MSDEKLPPEGFVPGPGWTLLPTARPTGYYHNDNDYYIPGGATIDYLIHRGAIVRKAEAPTCEWLVPTGEVVNGARIGRKCGEARVHGSELCAVHERRRPSASTTFEQLVEKVGPLASTALATAAEQLSGNTGGLPAWKCSLCRTTMSGDRASDQVCPVCLTPRGNTGECTGPFADWCPVHPRPGKAPDAPPRRDLLAELCEELRTSFRCTCDPETTKAEPCDCGGDGGSDGCWVCLANRYEELAKEQSDGK